MKLIINERQLKLIEDHINEAKYDKTTMVKLGKVLLKLTTNGAQPTSGVAVNNGVGRDWMQTVFTIESYPHWFLDWALRVIW